MGSSNTTKIRICAVGNSHLASIKAGWDAIRDEYRKTGITFFAAKSKLLLGLQVRDHTLVPSTEELRKAIVFTSGGLDHVAGDYDGYLIVGCEMSLRTLVLAVKEGGKNGLETLDANAELNATRAIQLVQQIHAISNAPVALMPAPYHAGAGAMEAYEWGRGAEAMTSLHETYIRTLKDLKQTHDFLLLQQPEDTLRPVEYLTKDEYRLSGERYDGRGKDNRGDGVHMNAELGMIQLRLAIKKFRKAAIGQASNLPAAASISRYKNP